MLLYATLKVIIMCPLINKVHLDEAKNEFNNVNGSQTMDPTKKVYLIKKNEWKQINLHKHWKKLYGGDILMCSSVKI